MSSGFLSQKLLNIEVAFPLVVIILFPLNEFLQFQHFNCQGDAVYMQKMGKDGIAISAWVFKEIPRKFLSQLFLKSD